MENVVTLEDIGNRIWSKLKPGIAGVGFKQVEAPETFSATPCLKVSWNSPGEPPKKRAHANPGSNVKETCPVCMATTAVAAAVPCGHLFCHRYLAKVPGGGRQVLRLQGGSHREPGVV